jgi:hypothetical protein
MGKEKVEKVSYREKLLIKFMGKEKVKQLKESGKLSTSERNIEKVKVDKISVKGIYEKNDKGIFRFQVKPGKKGKHGKGIAITVFGKSLKS